MAAPPCPRCKTQALRALSRRDSGLFAKRRQGVRERRRGAALSVALSQLIGPSVRPDRLPRRRTDRFSDIALSRAATNAFPGQSASCHVITPRSSHVPSQLLRLRASPGPPVPPRGNWVTNVEADEIDLRHHGRNMIVSIAHAACRNFRRRLPARQISLDPARGMNRLSGSLLGPVAYLDYLD